MSAPPRSRRGRPSSERPPTGRLGGNRGATPTARAYAKARLARSDERVVQTVRARDTLIGQALTDVRALRQAAWDALGDRDRSEL